jgi:hypothetical protein
MLRVKIKIMVPAKVVLMEHRCVALLYTNNAAERYILS